MKVVVSKVEDFAPDTRRIVNVGGREIGVFRLGDRFFGIRNRCPHQGGPLCQGRTVPLVVSDGPGKFELGGSMLVMCPWHGWHYDMETGEAYAPGDPRVKSYNVSIERGGDVVGAQGESGGSQPRLLAETFTVNIEDDYVVLDA
jgi:nitrite reductase/ring-hydroxylating ferredoxin subunit